MSLIFKDEQGLTQGWAGSLDYFFCEKKKKTTIQQKELVIE